MKNIIKSIVLIILLIISTSCKSTSNKELNYDNFDLAIMIESEKEAGKYEKYEGIDWPDKEDYTLNTALSTCKNNSTIEWDEEKGTIYLTSNKWDKCIAKFDKIIKIEYIEDLVDLSNRVNGGDSLKGKTVKLMRDLDFNNSDNDYKNSQNTEYGDFNQDDKDNLPIINELTDEDGAGFMPIGFNMSNKFEGNFDGNNHTLSNIHINNTKHVADSGNYFGLFGWVQKGFIADFTINGNMKTSVKNTIGGIIGEASNETIDNCHSSVNVTSDAPNNSLGGLIGQGVANTLIVNSSNSGKVSGSNNAGGLVGYVHDNATLTIEDSSNSGTVENNLGENAGGLVGRDNAATSTINISNSHNKGEIKVNKEIANTSYVGGLIGKVNGTVTIVESINKGKIDINSNTSSYTEVGGLVGHSTSSLIIKNSKNEIVESGSEYGINVISTGSGAVYTGGLVGVKYDSNLETIDSSNLSNIHVDFASESQYESSIGGLFGRVGASTLNGKILNSHNSGLIDVKKLIGKDESKIGGLVGWQSNGILSIDNSYNEGKISNSTSKGTNMGGILGYYNNYYLKINNSYNSGIIELKTTSGHNAFVGGVIGKNQSNDNLKINDSRNIAEKIEITRDSSDSDGIHVGGILGYNVNSKVAITNSYNLSLITGGVKIGGVVGYNDRSKLFVDNSYNFGNITTDFTSLSNALNLGGIIGYNAYGSNAYILNSYNTGSITNNGNDNDIYISGIIGNIYSNNNPVTTYIYNSYNSGDITNQANINQVSGIFSEGGFDNNNGLNHIVNINNIYNSGNLTFDSSNSKYSIGYMKEGVVEYDIKNAYYKKQEGVQASNIANLQGVSEIDTSLLLTNLNNNLTGISLEDMKSKLIADGLIDNTYNLELVDWIQSPDGYPTLEGVGN